MKDSEYYKSGKLTENARKAALLGAEVGKLKRLKRIEEYNKNPKLCKHCNSPINYDYKINQFCSKSCAGSYNGSRKPPRTEESKQKTALSLKGKPSPTKGKFRNYSSIFLVKCRICGKERYYNTKQKYNTTCGDNDCVIQACVGERPYQNGSRKPVKYFNKNENKEVLLESSWEVEVATKLDEHNIKWIRPKFIKWEDSLGKTRRYFPDFYLPDYDMYLDPKNPYCMNKDKEKMTIIEKCVNITYGDVKNIIEWIDEKFNENTSIKYIKIDYG